MAKRWWDDEDDENGDPLADDLPPEPAASNRRREAEPPRPALRHRDLPADDGPLQEHELRRRDEERQACIDANLRLIEREYMQHGLDPVRGGNGMLFSLSFLLRMGWTIGKTPSGAKVLLRPPEPPAPQPREEFGS